MIKVLVLDSSKLSEVLTTQGIGSGVITEGTILKTIGSFGFIETPEGLIFTDSEGVHYDPIPSQEKLSLPIYEDKPTEGGRAIGMFPKFSASLNFDEISREGLLLADTVPVVEFVRRFGARLESNFAELLNTLSAAGLDVSEDRAARKGR